MKNQILEAYILYANEKKTLPTLYNLADSMGIYYDLVYAHFRSREDIQEYMMTQIFRRTVDALDADPQYPQYSGYEKMLSFYFTFMQITQDYKTAVSIEIRQRAIMLFDVKSSLCIKRDFLVFMNHVFTSAHHNNEIPPRPWLQRYIDRIAWQQFQYLLHFMADDISENMSNTDAAIEKSTNLLFEFLGRNVLDAGFDFGKFFFQNL
ncbi:MAG: hypothetical protein RIS47_1832 [Bacteroidota bacterium]|jgi:AcrR family transcriptional regulator